jgi:rhodanese-related sulfurtransferase
VKLIIFFLSISLFASNEELRAVQKNGITIVDNNKTIVIQRKNPKKCNNVHINPPTLFGGDFAAKDIPKECKKTFVTIFGVLQPMHLYKGVKTVGELEVLSHIKKSEKKPKKYILIDARTQQWYHQMTIPTAVNLPFNQLHRYEVLEEDDENKIDEFEEMIEILGIIQRKSYLDFSRCKSAVIFCNGSWCSQSQKMIIKLINLGYPEEKLLWYRGGMQDWVLNGFTVTKGKF